MAGKYRVVSMIGEGGMSAVYEALHLGIGRPVALKVLQSSLGDDPIAMRRLEHEAQVVSTIGHPNICAIHDLGCTEDGCPYLVMERLLGETLGARLAAVGTLSFSEIAPIARAVLAALQAAHDKGVIHRDLKPDNVFLEPWRAGGRLTCKLLDFGIATFVGPEALADSQRLAQSGWQSGWVMGTPYYMAPEQARGDCTLDHRVDLWALGVILYEALTGRRPFVATNYNALLVKILTSQPRRISRVNASVSPQVESLVERAMAKLREDRFQTARQFSLAVTEAERLCATEDPHAPTLVMRRPRPRRARREPSRRPAHPWDERIEDPSAVIDDASTSVDRVLQRIATGQAVELAARADTLEQDRPVQGANPHGARRAPCAHDSDSATRPRTAPTVPRPRTAPTVPRPGAPEPQRPRSEDTATTLVVPRKR